MVHHAKSGLDSFSSLFHHLRTVLVLVSCTAAVAAQPDLLWVTGASYCTGLYRLEGSEESSELRYGQEDRSPCHQVYTGIKWRILDREGHATFSHSRNTTSPPCTGWMGWNKTLCRNKPAGLTVVQITALPSNSTQTQVHFISNAGSCSGVYSGFTSS